MSHPNLRIKTFGLISRFSQYWAVVLATCNFRKIQFSVEWLINDMHIKRSGPNKILKPTSQLVKYFNSSKTRVRMTIKYQLDTHLRTLCWVGILLCEDILGTRTPLPGSRIQSPPGRMLTIRTQIDNNHYVKKKGRKQFIILKTVQCEP